MRRLLAGTIVLVAMAAATGCGVATTRARQAAQEEPAQVLAATQIHAPARHTTRPDHLRMATIDAPVVPLHLSGSTLEPPADPTVLGWWGKPAGARHGATLLTGHTVHTGGGDLDDLEDVAVGTVATVSGHRYEVTSNRVISKDALARESARLFSQTGAPHLVVVTCENYDPTTGHYDSNVVLTADPVTR